MQVFRMSMIVLADNVADMTATCRLDRTVKCRHFWPTPDMSLSCKHKIDPNTTCLCQGWPIFNLFVFFYQSTYTQPAKNLYSTYVVLSTIR